MKQLSEKMVPVQLGLEFERRIRDRAPTLSKTFAEYAYVEYAAQYGTQQSLDRLHERGGFGVEEMLILLVERIDRLS